MGQEDKLAPTGEEWERIVSAIKLKAEGGSVDAAKWLAATFGFGRSRHGRIPFAVETKETRRARLMRIAEGTHDGSGDIRSAEAG